MPNINDAFPSNFLKASDLQGRQVPVTVDHVAFEPVGRTREMKAVCYFKGKEKGLVLNKTNGMKIAQIAGSALTEDWDGTRVLIYPTETEFGGETVDCIRVKALPTNGQPRAPRPAPEPMATLPPPTPAEFAPALTDDDIPF